MVVMMDAPFILGRAARGDPSPIAWLITLAYFVVAGLCFWAGRREKEAALGRARQWHAPLFWFVLCGLLVCLGLNKQLDLQSDLTQIGRSAARSGGWYEYRRLVQGVFVVLFGLGAAAAVASAVWFMRDVWRRYRMAFVGICYLCIFVIIRAASFHHIDTLLYHLPVGGYWVNTFFELGGNVILGLAAYRAATAKLDHQPGRAFEVKVRIR